MKYEKRWFAAVALAMSLGLVGCGTATSESAKPASAAAQLGDPDRNGVKAVTLSDQAAQRLGIATATVRSVARQVSHAARPELVIPYAALVYDDRGQTWAYVSSAPLTFVRHAVRVARIDGAEAYLSAGPNIGSAVVTTGSEELLGAEYEISGE